MRRALPVLIITVALLAMTNMQVHEAANSTGIYDADPEHIWNRVYKQFFVRNANGNLEFGEDTLDPLLWYETEAPFKSPTYQQTLTLLDNFLNSHAENLIVDPVKRAFFQRDLWAIFDWLSLRTDTYPVERQELRKRIVQIMRRVALTDAQIGSLPNNYSQAVSAHLYATQYQPNQPLDSFLPDDLWQADSAWVNVGNQNGILTITHVQSLEFSGRSTFYVFYRVPTDRQATLNFIATLNGVRQSHGATTVPPNTMVGLVRQMLLIDTLGRIVPTSITESVQLRVLIFSMAPQDVYQFNLSRRQLFGGKAGGLYAVGPDDKEFSTFMSHVSDVFENKDFSWQQEQSITLQLCQTCHLREDSNTIISYSRDRFPLPFGELPVLTETDTATEAKLVIAWKESQQNWQQLQQLWSSN